jgi:RNA polymerase sigma-70 factor (ECF subfamily)
MTHESAEFRGSTDEALLDNFRRGNRSALSELARRYERPLLGLASGLLDGRDDMARDAIQETWLRVIRFAGSFDGRSSLKTWLYRIAINQCRTAKSRMRGAAGDPGAGVPAPSSRVDPDDRTWLRAQVAALSPDKRTVLLLCYHEGMTHQLAAEILDVPLGTLKSRLHAALTTIRASLAAEAAP